MVYHEFNGKDHIYIRLPSFVFNADRPSLSARRRRQRGIFESCRWWLATNAAATVVGACLEFHILVELDKGMLVAHMLLYMQIGS